MGYAGGAFSGASNRVQEERHNNDTDRHKASQDQKVLKSHGFQDCGTLYFYRIFAVYWLTRRTGNARTLAGISRAARPALSAANVDGGVPSLSRHP